MERSPFIPTTSHACPRRNMEVPIPAGRRPSRGLLLIAAVAAPVWVAPGSALAQSDPAITYIADYPFSKGVYRKDLMVANADGTNRCIVWSRTSKNSLFNSHWDPAWSPDLDGNPSNGFQGTIAIVGDPLTRPGSAIFLVDVAVVGGVAQGQNIRELVASDLDPAAGTSFSKTPDWSPDLDPVTPGYQGKIAYHGRVLDTTDCVSTIEVRWDGVSVQPTHGPNSSVVLTTAGGFYPTWSPGGDRIAIHPPGGNAIWVLDASTGLVVDTVGVGSNEPQWSRTGSRIAYLGGGNQLYTVDIDLGPGSSQQLISEPCGKARPAWSPDDQFIIYQKFSCESGNGTSVIRRVEVATGATMTLISQSKVYMRFPDWRRF